eukprot:15454928-Alexandrium_andersonii.AAC.1
MVATDEPDRKGERRVQDGSGSGLGSSLWARPVGRRAGSGSALGSGCGWLLRMSLKRAVVQ